MHHDVRPMLKGPAQIWGSKGVVNNEREIVLVRHVSDRLDVEHISPGIADSLPIEQFGLRCDSAAAIVRISGIDKVNLDTKALKRQGKLVVCPAIEGTRRHHLIPS